VSYLSIKRGYDTTWTRLYFLTGGILLTAGLLSACVGDRFAAIRPGLDKRGHYIEGVPFFRQSESTCGPAALANVISFWGRSANIDDITAKVYLPALRGTLPMDMERFARESGFDTSSSSGTLADLKENIGKGVPLICMLDLGFGLYRQPHYVTVVGFDDGNALIIEHDGIKPNRLVAYDTFNHSWARTGYWMLVISPKKVEIKDVP
jgi:ABC-type bacteriocin/lantibiotic exporter with double-glycine peptidase domain